MIRTNCSSSWMVTLLFTIIFCIGTISCAKASKKNTNDFRNSDSVISTSAEDTTIIKIGTFIIPKKSETKHIYKSPSKSAAKLIYVLDDETAAQDGIGGYYAWKETSTTEGDYYTALPVIEKKDNWYKVYVRTPIYKDHECLFVGYVPNEEWVEASRQSLTEDDIKSDFTKMENGFHRDANYYVSWGMSEFGEDYFVIGKIVDGIAFETKMIYYGYEDEKHVNLYLDWDLRDEGTRLRNVKISTTFDQYKNTDFEKVLSLIGNGFPNILIKLDGAKMLYYIPSEENINGRKVEWDF